ncbi:MAG TPA: hypothetical protein VMI53_09720 [Opitutaceae bacterium]|nr:hypothetical protein [Opitutaceae bacterium]
MKTRTLILVTALGLQPAALLWADDTPEPPVPVVPAPPPPPASYPPADNQKLYGGIQTPLVTPDTAKAIVDKFHAAFVQNEAPRFVFYVNRELIDADSGLQLTKRTERTEATRSDSGGNGQTAPGTQTEKVVAHNTYEAKDMPAPTLADRQTVRDVERLFGRPFRAAGAHLADQKVAASILADKPFDTFAAGGSDQARKEREALANVADVAVEVLVSSRNVTVTNVSGDETVTVPDIQATAIRLKDSAIIGQASSSDVLGKDPQAGRLAQRYDVRDITEATALALMEDMASNAK